MHNIEGCTVLHCRLCRTAAQDRVIAKRLERSRRQLLDYIARDISTADLERINITFPNLLPEAVRELNGEVEYIQPNLTK